VGTDYQSSRNRTAIEYELKEATRCLVPFIVKETASYKRMIDSAGIAVR
jgi:hypothetical protein